LSEPDYDPGVPWWVLGVGLVVLCGVLFIGARVGTTLTGLLFPPQPPHPRDAEQIDYTREMHGFDTWQYHREPGTACETIQFYREQGGTCEVMLGHCERASDDEFLKESALAATCSGEEAFSNFVMHWQAEIYDYPEHTRILLEREIPWTRTRE
jgi:hypothetical protein